LVDYVFPPLPVLHWVLLVPKRLRDFLQREPEAVNAVRKANPALRRGAFHLLEADPGRQLYAFERRAPDNRCIVALNRSDRHQAFPVSPDLPATELLSNHPIRGDRVTVPARQAVIVRLEEGRRRIGRPAAPGAFWARAGRASVSQEQHART
jgi:hypothetical protein